MDYPVDHQRSKKRCEYFPYSPKVAQQRVSNKLGDRLAMRSRFGTIVPDLPREML
jgi:hypothetical protein